MIVLTLEEGRLRHVMPSDAFRQRRQELPAFYGLHGAVYVVRIPWFRSNRTFVSEETVAHVMPGSRSLDIDEQEDLDLARLILERRFSQP